MSIILGSAAEQKGITVIPKIVMYNGNNVTGIMCGTTQIWSSWDGTLYNAGDEYNLYTGGYSGYGTQTGTFVKADTYMRASIGGAQRMYVDTTEPIDLTNYNTLYFYGYGTDSSSYNDLPAAGIVADRSKSGAQKAANYDYYVSFANSTSLQTISLDISSLTGLYYVRFGTNAGVSCTRVCQINKIWLE